MYKDLRVLLLNCTAPPAPLHSQFLAVFRRTTTHFYTRSQRLHRVRQQFKLQVLVHGRPTDWTATVA
jgi:hypothetical protein